jgi:hypothetical protein
VRVKLNDKWGFLNNKGVEVVPPRYKDTRQFYEGMAAVKLIDKWGFIDKNGNEVIEAVYQDVKDFSENLAAVRLDNKWGFIDKAGKEIIARKYQSVPAYYSNQFKEGLVAVELNNKWGMIDKTGREVIPLQYDESFSFSDGKAKVKKDGQEFYINKSDIAEVKYGSPGTQATGQQTATKSQPPLAMKGSIDPAIVGVWKFHSPALGLTTYYAFREDGTYDYYNNVISPTNPLATRNCYWRLDGNYLETLCGDYKQAVRYAFLKRNDPTTGKPALIIEFKDGAPASRMYITMDDKTPWK